MHGACANVHIHTRTRTRKYTPCHRRPEHFQIWACAQVTHERSFRLLIVRTLGTGGVWVCVHVDASIEMDRRVELYEGMGSTVVTGGVRKPCANAWWKQGSKSESHWGFRRHVASRVNARETEGATYMITANGFKPRQGQTSNVLCERARVRRTNQHGKNKCRAHRKHQLSGKLLWSFYVSLILLQTPPTTYFLFCRLYIWLCRCFFRCFFVL